MKKILSISFLVCLLAGFSGCADKNNQVESNATDNYIQVETTTKTEKDIFCNKIGIGSVEENYSCKTADGDVKNGILITSGTKNANLYYAYPVDMKETNDSVISFEIPYTDIYQTSKIEITLVDIYDEDNSITVAFSGYEYNALWAAVAAKNSNFNTFAGYNTHGTDSGYSNSMIFPYNNMIGTADGDYYHYAFNLCYDTEENQVYLKLKDSDIRLICDFDDDYFTKNSKAFQGFTDNRVYVNIKFSGIVKTGAIFVQSIGNRSLSGAIDYSLPCDNIKIETDNGKVFYDGAVGYAYEIPKPIQDDMLLGEQKVDVAVAKIGGDTKITLDEDYAFIPSQAGNYKATYSTKDFLGNDVAREYAFIINESPTDIEVSFEEVMYEIGDVKTLPIVDVSGGSGKIEYFVSYEYDGQTYNSGEEVHFAKLGALCVKVKASDAIGYTIEKEQCYDVEPKVLCYLETPMPQATRIGEKLQLPTLFAYDYINGEEMSKKVYVNGSIVEDGVYTVEETDINSLTVEYYANEGLSNEEKLSYTVTVFNQEESYFLYDEEIIDMQIGESYTSFKARNALSTMHVAYPYALSCDLLNINLLLGEHSKCSYTDVKLTDYANGTSITYRLKYKSGSLVIALRDEKGEFTNETLATDYLESDGVVNLYYNDAEKTLLNYSYNSIATVSYTDDGDVFKGFSGGVYVEFIVFDMKADGELQIVQLSNQEFSVSKLSAGDRTAPVLANVADIAFGDKELNETILIPVALAFDVLTGEKCEVRVSVIGPSETILDGEVLTEGREVCLNEYGVWLFIFEAKDSNNRSVYYEEVVNVKDDIPPTISISDFNIGKVKVNETITIPSMSVNDNIENSEIASYILIRDPNMQYHVIEGNKITFDKKGLWVLVYYAKDADGNITTKEISIQVE